MRRNLGLLLVVVLAAAGCGGSKSVNTSATTATTAASSSSSSTATSGTTATTVAGSSTTVSQVSTITTTLVNGKPHFGSPEDAMRYLADAWNRNDLVSLKHVTDPSARDELNAMHGVATNLRLNHCTKNEPAGD